MPRFGTPNFEILRIGISNFDILDFDFNTSLGFNERKGFGALVLGHRAHNPNFVTHKKEMVQESCLSINTYEEVVGWGIQSPKLGETL
jgi:hypothetical protein